MKKNLKNLFLLTFSSLLCVACGINSRYASESAPTSFVRVCGSKLIEPNGDTLFIKGTNLGNWLNPEGYMFLFGRTNSVGMIDEAFRQMVGPETTDAFWREWRQVYITEDDIRFIAETGANTIRLPFHYKVFTTDPYLGARGEAVAQVDSCVAWCKRHGLYLILDMHDAPGGQTGDNIDDSYGYPWLFTDEEAQSEFIAIWQKIATRYKDEPTILGYELMNEPIAHYFADDLEMLNARMEPLCKRTVAAIREVDTEHIILLGGVQWNGTFHGVFHDWTYDDKLMWTCHRYGHSPDDDGIRNFIEWRDSTNLPMYMGETGHQPNEWIRAECETLQRNDIGYTFWPYKKMGNSCWCGFRAPENWDLVREFVEGDRSNYRVVRERRPNQAEARQILFGVLTNCRDFTPDWDYIHAMLLK